MKKLLEAINRGILKGLNERNINLLADLDDELGDAMQIKRKNINTNSEKDIIVSLLKNIIHKFNETPNGDYDSTITENVKRTINNPDNFYEYASIIPAKNKEQLRKFIYIGRKIFGNDGNFNWIDTREITDMSYLFDSDTNFNGHIELWDVSNVNNMCRMFWGSSFNQPIGDWDVSNVTDMSDMFCHTSHFNQPIGDWDVSNVTDMAHMFYCADNFNQPIGEWDVSSVTNMEVMFSSAREFNQPIGDWDVSSVTNMRGMFSGASSFNQAIGSWDVSNVNNMSYMFSNAASFNQPLHNWTIRSHYSNTARMFIDCPIKEEYKPKGIKEDYKPRGIK